jgi:hypothetical protein
VTSAGGRDQFLIVASRHALVDLEAALEHYETARQGRQVAGGETEQLRGIGGYLPEEPGEAASGGLSSLAAQLVRSAGADSPVWTRTLVLENPAD